MLDNYSKYSEYNTKVCFRGIDMYLVFTIVALILAFIIIKKFTGDGVNAAASVYNSRGISEKFVTRLKANSRMYTEKSSVDSLLDRFKMQGKISDYSSEKVGEEYVYTIYAQRSYFSILRGRACGYELPFCGLIE